MKKLGLIIIAFIIFCFIVNNNKTKEEYYTIPDIAIRLRIVANSNNTYDQIIKQKVKDNIEKELIKLVTGKTVEEVRKLINEDINMYEKIVIDTLEKLKYNKDLNIHFGNNYFPEKLYNGIYYEEGYYESLVITIGDGKGDNWWCILFPPLCNLEVTKGANIEYKLFVKELVDKYLFKK